tara:strand:+ start:2618 stop:3703 length:1086 start_codon:yes stop_codon:yes gene_type:complete
MKIIDCDVHPRMNSMSQLHPYLTEEWRQRMGVQTSSKGSDSNTARNVFTIPKRWYFHPHGAERNDAIPPDGGRPGSDLKYFCEKHLDFFEIDHAVMISGDLFGVGGLPDADMAAAFISANNDWLLHEWAEKDSRLKLAINVGPRDPNLAVQEIERLGGNDSVVQVQIPEFDVLLGNRHFYPIYEAAERYGLPIGFHGAGESAGVNTPMSPVGIPSYFIEVHTGMPMIGQAHVISLVAEGVFERFPKLKFVFQEVGYAWVPSVMWRFDQEWKSMRNEVPWLTKPPSEYILENVRFTTQPICEAPDNFQHMQLLDMLHADKTLVFSSDYPHWDFDDPRKIFTGLSDEVKKRIYFESAAELYDF